MFYTENSNTNKVEGFSWIYIYKIRKNGLAENTNLYYLPFEDVSIMINIIHLEITSINSL